MTLGDLTRLQARMDELNKDEIEDEDADGDADESGGAVVPARTAGTSG